MIDNREVWACANQLMKQHGADAWYVAAQRADELFYAGDMDGHKTFARIVRRIEQLESMQPETAIH